MLLLLCVNNIQKIFENLLKSYFEDYLESYLAGYLENYLGDYIQNLKSLETFFEALLETDS